MMNMKNSILSCFHKKPSFDLSQSERGETSGTQPESEQGQSPTGVLELSMIRRPASEHHKRHRVGDFFKVRFNEEANEVHHMPHENRRLETDEKSQISNHLTASRLRAQYPHGLPSSIKKEVQKTPGLYQDYQDLKENKDYRTG